MSLVINVLWGGRTIATFDPDTPRYIFYSIDAPTEKRRVHDALQRAARALEEDGLDLCTKM